MGNGKARRCIRQDAADHASDMDSRYFEAHPGETEYIRERLPGEFSVAEPMADGRCKYVPM